jgi:hypothetical protein
MDSACVASAEEWGWFRASAEGHPDGWWVLHGRTQVERTNGRFKAVLHDSEDYSDIRQTLRGTIAGGRVRARVTTLGSDAQDYNVSGTLKRQCWPGNNFNGSGREIIILINGKESIGLMRTLWGRSCKPTP